MNIQQLIELQRQFDERHGWTPTSESERELLHYLSTDLVGLLGEIGEFANLVKKLNLIIEDERQLPQALLEARPALEEELVDTFIYVLRLASHLGVDLEKGYAAKMARNKERFARFLVDPSE